MAAEMSDSDRRYYENVAKWAYWRSYAAMNPDLSFHGPMSAQELSEHYFQSGIPENRKSKRTMADSLQRTYSTIVSANPADRVYFTIQCDASDEHSVHVAEKLKAAIQKNLRSWVWVGASNSRMRCHLVIHVVEANSIAELGEPDLDTPSFVWTWHDPSKGDAHQFRNHIQRVADAWAVMDASQFEDSSHLMPNHQLNPFELTGHLLLPGMPDRESFQEVPEKIATTRTSGPLGLHDLTNTLYMSTDPEDRDFYVPEDVKARRAMMMHVIRSKRMRRHLQEKNLDRLFADGYRTWDSVAVEMRQLLVYSLGQSRKEVDLLVGDNSTHAETIKTDLYVNHGVAVRILPPSEWTKVLEIPRRARIATVDVDDDLSHLGLGDDVIRIQIQDREVPLVDTTVFCVVPGKKRANTIFFTEDAQDQEGYRRMYPRDNLMHVPRPRDQNRVRDLYRSVNTVICQTKQDVAEALCCGASVLYVGGPSSDLESFVPRELFGRSVRTVQEHSIRPLNTMKPPRNLSVVRVSEAVSFRSVIAGLHDDD